MKNSELRTMLEKQILSLKNSKKELTDEEFEKYCNCLFSLHRLNRMSVLEQNQIYAATHGDIVNFVLDFIRYISPLAERRKKKIHFDTVLHTRTSIMFSPRLTEIALGCILWSFLANADSVKISFFTNISHVGVSVLSRKISSVNNDLSCVAKIAYLHGGRVISELCDNQTKINLVFPIFANFQPIKLIPCKTELCRLCRI